MPNPSRRFSRSSRSRRDASHSPTPPISARGVLPSRHRLLRAARGRALQRRGPRSLLALLPLVVIALLFLIGRRYVAQQVDVESIIRGQVIPRLEKQIGRRIEVGRVESDWLSRVIIHDVVIGRDARLPLGALGQIRRAVLDVDVVGLALRRVAGVNALRGATLEGLQIDLRRDARGRLNWLELLQKQPQSTAARWAGTVRLRDARIYYQDQTVRSRRGRVLISQARGIDGDITLNGDAPTIAQLTIPRLWLRDEKLPMRDVKLAGEIDANAKWALANVTVPSAPLPLLAQWALPRGEADFTRGTVGAKVQIAYDASAPASQQILARGDLQLRDASGFARDFKLPNSTQPLLVQNAGGDLSFDNRAFTIRSLQLTALGTTAQIRGTLALPENAAGVASNPIFDLDIATQNADSARLMALLPRASLNGARLQMGRAAGRVRLRGDSQNLRATGDLSLPDFVARQANNGLRSSRLTARFDTHATLKTNALQSTKGRVVLSAPDFSLIGDAFKARGIALQSTISFDGQRRGATFDGTANADWGARRSEFSTNAGAAQLAQWRGTSRGAWQNGRARAVLSLRSTGVAGQNGSGANRTAFNGGALEAAAWFIGTPNSGRAAIGATLRDWQMQSPQAGAARGALWKFAAATPAIAPRQFSKALWSGTTQWREADVSRLALARLAPSAATSLRDIGTSSGRLRFAAFSLDQLNRSAQSTAGRTQSTAGRSDRFAWTNLPVVDGEASLSRATIGGVRLNGARTRFSLRDGVLRLSGAQTQSEAGIVRADVEADLNGDLRRGVRLAVSAPQVAIDAARINPYLSRLGLQATGTLNGRLDLANGGADNTFRASWDFDLARGQIRSLPLPRARRLLASGQILDLADARVRGDGVARLGQNNSLRFDGQTQIDAARARAISTGRITTANGAALPSWLSGSAVSSAQLLLRGSVSNGGTGKAPLAFATRGALRIGRVALPILPSARRDGSRNAPPRIDDVRVAFAADSGDKRTLFEAPRLSARIGEGRVDGHFSLRRDGQVSGQLLASRFDVAQLQQTIGSDWTAWARLAVAPRPTMTSLAAQGIAAVATQFAAGPAPLSNAAPIVSDVADFLSDDSTRPTPPAVLWNAETTSSNSARISRVALPSDEQTTRAFPPTLPNSDAPRSNRPAGISKPPAGVSNSTPPRLKVPQKAVASAAKSNVPDDLKLRGLAFARMQFSGRWPNLRVALQSRLTNGAATSQGLTVALDAVRFDTEIALPDFSVVPIRELSVWSRGARVSVSGSAARRGDQWALKMSATANGVRLRDARLAPVPFLRGLVDDAQLDGAGSAQVKIDGTLQSPRIEGRARVQLARAFGLPIDDATSNILLAGSPVQPRLELTQIAGRTGDAPFGGSLKADWKLNTWTARFDTSGLASTRLVRAADRLPEKSRPITLTDLPLRGALTADIDMSGTLLDTRGRFAPRPYSGTATVVADALRWRGQALGSVNADLSLEKGVLQIAGIQLWRPAQGESGADPNGSTSLLRLTGAIPLDRDAPGLEARLVTEDARVSTLIQAAREMALYLQSRGDESTLWAKALAAIDALPSGLEGRVAVDARLSGSLARPALNFERVALRDARYRYDGGVQQLPRVDAAFDYDNERREIVLRRADLSLASEKEDEKGATTLHLESGGRIELDGAIDVKGDLENASLRQIAAWSPALRGPEGEALVGGKISRFRFAIGGALPNPTVTGELIADDLVYRDYNIDQLKIRNFLIGDGQFVIARNDLELRKGDFLSKSASVNIPWTWGGDGESPGPRREADIAISLPLESDTFGALAGVLVPALQRADADEFSGGFQIGGRLSDPQLSGEVRIRNGRFELNPKTLPIDVGLSGVSGTVRFLPGNRLQIDADDPVRGNLAPPNRIDAATVNRSAKKNQQKSASEIDLAGTFAVRGGVDFDLNPQTLERGRESLSAHRYDLSLALDGGAISIPNTPTIRDASLGVVWKTRADAPIAQRQNIRWMMAVQGQSPKRGNSGGAAYSFGSLDLHPDFGAGMPALMRSRIGPLTAFDGLENLGVAKKLAILVGAPKGDLSKMADPRAQFRLDSFAFAVKGLARGTLDGRLIFDNNRAAPAPLVRRRPTLALRLETSRIARDGAPSLAVNADTHAANALQSTADARLRYFEASSDSKDAPKASARYFGAARVAPELARIVPIQDGDDDAAVDDNPIRISGEIALSNAQISGVPSGGEGAAIVWPDAPALNLRAVLGRGVQFITPNLRAEVTGAAEINGTPRDPVIIGNFATRSGQVRFPNANARIVEGEIAVTVSRDPTTGELRPEATIDATARGQADRYQITLTLRGPLDLGSPSTQNLRVDVSSNPPLSQDQAFSRLFGTASAGSLFGGGQSNQAYARAVVSLVSAPLFAGVERTLEQALGLSSITFEYRFNEPLAVQVGKAIGDRIYISYRRTLGSSRTNVAAGATAGVNPTGDALRIEYRLKGDVQLVYQYGRDQLGIIGAQAGLAGNARQSVTLEKTWRF